MQNRVVRLQRSRTVPVRCFLNGGRVRDVHERQREIDVGQEEVSSGRILAIAIVRKSGHSPLLNGIPPAAHVYFRSSRRHAGVHWLTEKTNFRRVTNLVGQALGP